MLGGQPNHDWQLCSPLCLHTGYLDFRLKDLSIDETGSDAFGCCQAHPGIPVGFLFSGIQFYVLLNISWLCLLFILIYMF